MTTTKLDRDDSTSMRPAQKAPENRSGCRRASRRTSYFNEAGAKSAGKPKCAHAVRSMDWNFNEAGAKSAGKRRRHAAGRGQDVQDFNEAGAKSAGKRRGDADAPRPEEGTSMRPAQKAPENLIELLEARSASVALQ